MSDQLPLFSVAEQWQTQGYRVDRLTPQMSAEALLQWKIRIIDFQERIEFCPAPQQVDLFGDAIPSGEPDPEAIHPFKLEQRNINFWQSPSQDEGVAAIYFVIDYEAMLLLYVGETVKSNQRWKGVHDCKRYLANYRQSHYEHQLPTRLGIGFWPHAPRAQRSRQTLEAALIKKWRAPFNKENWAFWGTPFVDGKVERPSG
ncbi:MAG: GIY-YIG nuclease family protein [Synechococcales cyanobacterium RM1_1_8]|nr:GIY-YIG nuclease family protein [Synechococcales cyanobacterium RM1_1_8]